MGKCQSKAKCVLCRSQIVEKRERFSFRRKQQDFATVKITGRLLCPEQKLNSLQK